MFIIKETYNVTLFPTLHHGTTRYNLGVRFLFLHVRTYKKEEITDSKKGLIISSTFLSLFFFPFIRIILSEIHDVRILSKVFVS